MAKAGIYNIRITNILGQELYSRNTELVNEINTEVDVEILAQGTYYLILTKDKTQVNIIKFSKIN